VICAKTKDNGAQMSMQKSDLAAKKGHAPDTAAASLDADQWRAAFRKLDELLTLPAQERAAVLAANDAGADGSTVFSAVRDWCDRTTGLNANSNVTHGSGLSNGIGSAAADVLGAIAASHPGQQFGNYVLLDQIGQGGMGSVWRAERSDGLYKAQVAVKMLGAMALSSHARARFAQEGETLALLSHPNIARLLDAGITPDGQRFLVLELVQGLSLNDYVKQHAPSSQQKLALFRQLLSAIAFAHDRLVVHRDLKPSNVMITADGTLKLLDFGVSKLLDDGTATDGDLTRDYGAAYTEAYAPPEQMRGEPTATGADIFALGVLLHELIGGQRITWSRKKFDLQPGDRPANLNRIESPDLRSIVRKAVEVSSTDRYRTALAMDEDIARYMAGDAVLAHEGGFAYRARRFVMRNKLMVGATAAVFSALVAGAGAATWQWRVAISENQRAEAASRDATAEATRANGEAARASAEAKRANAEAERAGAAAIVAEEGKRETQKALERADAAARRATQQTAQALQANQQAKSETARAVVEAQKAASVKDFLVNLLGANSVSGTNAAPGALAAEASRKTTAEELLVRGATLVSSADSTMPAQVRSELFVLVGGLLHDLHINDKAIDVRRARLNALPASAPQSTLAQAVFDLADSEYRKGDIAAQRQTLKRLESAGLRDPEIAARLTFREGRALLLEQKGSEGVAQLERAVKLLAPFPNLFGELIQARLDLGEWLRLSDTKRAEQVLTESLQMIESRTQISSELRSDTLTRMINFYGRAQRLKETDETYKRAVNTLEPIGENALISRAVLDTQYASALLGQGRRSGVRPLLESAISAFDQRGLLGHVDIPTNALFSYAQVLVGEHENSAAEDRLHSVLKAWLDPGVNRASVLQVLATAQSNQGKYSEARANALLSLDIRKQKLVATHFIVALTQDVLANIAINEKNWEEAAYRIAEMRKGAPPAGGVGAFVSTQFSITEMRNLSRQGQHAAARDIGKAALAAGYVTSSPQLHQTIFFTTLAAAHIDLREASDAKEMLDRAALLAPAEPGPIPLQRLELLIAQARFEKKFHSAKTDARKALAESAKNIKIIPTNLVSTVAELTSSATN
jgi:hypothetical protein